MFYSSPELLISATSAVDVSHCVITTSPALPKSSAEKEMESRVPDLFHTGLSSRRTSPCEALLTEMLR